jgi:hypothetical protein
MRTVVHDRLISSRPSRSPSPAPPLALLALALALLSALAGCTTVTSPSGKITYTRRVQVTTQPAVTTPSHVHMTAAALCDTSKHEYIIAGGYNLTAPNSMDGWLAAHPEPTEARPDQYGLYRPIPPLLRVTASNPGGLPNGWSVTADGMVYPSEGTHTLTVYAYCAAGLTLPPQLVRTAITATNVGSNLAVDAVCPAGTIASSGGYATGTYSYAGSPWSAYLPAYRSLWRPNAWQIATDQFYRTMPSGSPTFTPYPSATVLAEAVCVSTNDFARVESFNGPELFISPTTPELQMVSYTVGSDIDFRGQYTQRPACPAGSFVLPPSYNVGFSSNSSQDVRVDGIWVSETLDSWTMVVSTGGAAIYLGAAILTAYATCLIPK